MLVKLLVTSLLVALVMSKLAILYRSQTSVGNWNNVVYCAIFHIRYRFSAEGTYRSFAVDELSFDELPCCCLFFAFVG